MLATWQGIRRAQPDVVHSFYITDALVAQRLAKTEEFPTVLTINGMPHPGAFRRFLPPDRSLVRRVIRNTDVMVTCSQFVADLIYAEYGVVCRVIVPPIDLDLFKPLSEGRSAKTDFLAVGDFDQENKGLLPLMRAFKLVKEKIPDATLKLSGRMSEATRQAALAALDPGCHTSLQLLGLGQPGDLPGLYASATALVIPSMWEASGTVMFEAWASGTPVIATRHGGLPEFVTPQVGVLFDPDSEGQVVENIVGLADAMIAGLELAATPDISHACREHSRQYSWAEAGSQYEAVYADVIDRRG
jgi:glycosyltransferase involved in cell wall biosynthesis